MALRWGERLLAFGDAPRLGFSWMLPGPANSCEIRIVALRRSGHHAIVNWLLNQIEGPCVFLNDCKAGTNPFLSSRRADSRYQNGLFHHNRLWWRQEAAGRHSKRRYLLYNYEDCSPAEVVGSAEASRERWVGRSAQRFDMLVLRDPYNMLASRLRWCYGTGYWQPPTESLFAARELWKEHAREYLNDTNHLPERINVNYNSWFVDPNVRQTLANKLGVKWTDKGIDDVARWGPTTWGDSFDGLTYDGRASRMRVLERWTAYASDPFFRRLCDDEELKILSERAFGPLPGIDAVLERRVI